MKNESHSRVCIITVTGKDQVGIIARISRELAELDVNIIDVNQKIMSEELFVMTMACDMASSSTTMSELKKRLAEAGEQLDLRINCQDEKLFTEMHRV
ncbi:ACT domain-containing protein [Sedimentisphaera salicampi]|uniref:Formyltetrahydrofolate deformylase n=1 Tax=Sedimentisphaera salicampi TaxID=1941349 RepID=A0A1W6LNQ4_9BACT|nr:ACT domain-containing protein [Sedimentisphaera salicampi]ARN57371.1 formyltetrahydrofolate deformylase [Sedimentisphaera salicampi]OXU14576.1 formyltetrahydrofolate deformylase [Sedimentisphaera salicampi]